MEAGSRRHRPPVGTTSGSAAPRLRVLNGFAYLLSLGFKPASLLPPQLADVALALDEGLGPLAPGLGMRVLAVWERSGDAGTGPARRARR